MNKLDKNLRDKMRGLLPFNADSIEYYTPKEYKDLPDEYKPIFHVKPWTQKTKERIEIITEKLNSEKLSLSEKSNINKELSTLCRKQVITIDKLYDVGKEEFINVDIEDGCISKDTWESIPQKIHTSIYFLLMSISGLVSSEIVGL